MIMSIELIVTFVVAVLIVIWISISQHQANEANNETKEKLKRLQIRYDYLDRQIDSIRHTYDLCNNILRNDINIRHEILKSEIQHINSERQPWYIKLSHKLIDKYNES